MQLHIIDYDPPHHVVTLPPCAVLVAILLTVYSSFSDFSYLYTKWHRDECVVADFPIFVDSDFSTLFPRSSFLFPRGPKLTFMSTPQCLRPYFLLDVPGPAVRNTSIFVTPDHIGLH